MERRKVKNDAGIGIFPVYFKKVGLIIMVLAFVPLLIVKFTGIELFQTQKEFFKTLTLNIIILGLFFVAWSKDKIEDEMTIHLRYKSLAFAFFTGVLYMVLKPFIDLLFNEPAEDISAQGLLLFMLIFYLIQYYIQKRGK